MKKTIILSTILVTATGYLEAQNGSVTSGGDASGSGGKASYSIGQVDYITANGSGGTITQGLQQPYEISTNGIEQANSSLSGVSLYPNPATDFIVLSVQNLETQKMSYALCDQLGKILAKEELNSSQTAILMEEFPNATYFIKVYNNKEVKTFKIIKNK
jgi:hypothetical protein